MRTIIVVGPKSDDNPSGNTTIEAKDFDPAVHELIDASDAEVVEAAQQAAKPKTLAMPVAQELALKTQLDELIAQNKAHAATHLEAVAQLAANAETIKAMEADVALLADVKAKVKLLDDKSTKTELQAVLVLLA